METYENKRRRAKARLTEKQLTAHAKSRAAFARAREIWSAVPGCDPYAALRQAWAEVTAGKIPPNFTKAVKPPKPKKPKTNPQDLITVVVVDTKKGEIIRFKLPGDQYALMRDLEPGFDEETTRLWDGVRSRGVSGKVKSVTSDYPTSTLTFTVQNGSYRPTMTNPSESEGTEQSLNGYTVRQEGNKHKIIDPDGNDTGKYAMTEEGAARLLAKHAR